jgi:Cys-tRNA(Pro)/Cys-tRNA(Cys) deacylase
MAGGAGIRLATPKDLRQHIGYPTKGVSPLGVKDCPLFIDAEVVNYHTILVGAGVVGVEIELSPDDLIALTNGTVMPISYPPQHES